MTDRGELPRWRLSRLFLQGVPLVLFLVSLPTVIDFMRNGATQATHDTLGTLTSILLVTAIIGAVLEASYRPKST